jgi:hypothetical protein
MKSKQLDGTETMPNPDKNFNNLIQPGEFLNIVAVSLVDGFLFFSVDARGDSRNLTHAQAIKLHKEIGEMIKLDELT